MPVPTTSSRICPNHSIALELRSGRYGSFYGCPAWPDCDIIGDTSQHDKKFRISDQSTRDARKRAHAAFDPLWQERWLKRGQAYKWLADRLNLTSPEMHIEYLTVIECDVVVQLCSQKSMEIKALKALGREPELPAPMPESKKSKSRKRKEQRQRAKKTKVEG